MKQVETGSAISYGWESVKKNFWYFIGLAALYVAITSIPSTGKDDTAVLNFFGFIISAYLSAGMLHLVLSYIDGKTLPLSDLFTQTKYFWRVLGAMVLVFLIVAAGFILFIVPGIIWGLRYQFVLNLIVDKDMDISEAMHKSAELTKGVMWQLLVFNLAVAGVTILGALVLGVGILVAIPVTWLADVYVYRHLLKATNETNKTKEVKEEKPEEEEK